VPLSISVNILVLVPANVGLVYVGAFPEISAFETVATVTALTAVELASALLALEYETVPNDGADGALELILKSDIAVILFILFCNDFIEAYNTTKYSASSGKLAIELASLALIEGYVI
tara:strand:- start:6 stop:359 length:354 start_codon:yes stop_codon:yes gene_type:complete